MLQTAKPESITPAKAELYLNRNKGNRSLREGVVEKYAHDMRTGKWTDCIDPIAFYEDGDIADGQHRLFAIVESGKTITFLVLHGVPRDAGLNIDTGITRTVVDNARISGLDLGLSNVLVSAAPFYQNGEFKKVALSNSDRLAIVAKYRPELEWAISNGPTGKGLRNAPILSAVARAYKAGVDPERLKKFCVVLSKGLSDGVQDSAAITLRNYIITREKKIAHTESRDLFLKTMNAISYFIRRKTLGTIRTVSEEAYPLKKR